MKILDRYVLFAFLKNYLMSFMVLVGLYVVLDMLFNFDELMAIQAKEGLTGVATIAGLLKTIGDYYFYQIFLFFVQLSGIIPVVAAAFTLMRMSRFNELSAILSSGVPLLRVTMPIILAAVVLNGLLLVDQELVIPQMIPKLTRNHNEAGLAQAKNMWPIPSMQDGNNLIVASRYSSAPTVAPDQPPGPPQLEKLSFIKRNDQLQPEWHLSAEKAVWDAEGQAWKLVGGKIDVVTDKAEWDPAARAWKPRQRGGFGRLEGATASADDAGPGPAAGAGSAGDDALPKEPLPSNVYVDEANKLRIDAVVMGEVTPEEIALYKSAETVSLLSTEKINRLLERTSRYGVNQLMRVQHARFTQPLINIILLLLAIPCVLTREPGRLKSAALKCLVLSGLCLASVFLSQLLSSRPPSREIAANWPAIMAWAPIFAFGPVSVWLLDRVKT